MGMHDIGHERRDEAPAGEPTLGVGGVAVAADGSVVAHVQEVTELYFQDGRSSVDHTTYGMTHVLIFDRTATGWVLATATRPPGTKCGVPPETEFCGQWSQR